jgi:membrane fusion protein (multidrug efflux system)
MRLKVLVLIGLCSLAVPANAQQAQPQAVAVGTVYSEKKPIAKSLDIVGRVEAIERVEVKARVTGYLEAMLFKEGDLIKEGAKLYRIEKGLFEAAVTQAQGALERSKSAKVLTEIQLQRAEQLLASSSGTAVARDQALAADQQAKGAIMADEANLDTAKINLGYTDITSPIAGKVGKTNITKGNVVSPESGVLTTIVSQDPMYVSFPISQREILQARQSGGAGQFGNIKVRIKFSNGTVYPQVGEMNFIDVTVDRTTDTVLARATVANPAGTLIDGQLVQVMLESGKPDEKVLVPQAALLADQGGVYVFVVEDGKAVTKRIKTSGERGADVVVDEGLSGGEQIVVEGLSALRPGASVQASPVQRTLKGS